MYRCLSDLPQEQVDHQSTESLQLERTPAEMMGTPVTVKNCDGESLSDLIINNQQKRHNLPIDASTSAKRIHLDMLEQDKTATPALTLGSAEEMVGQNTPQFPCCASHTRYASRLSQEEIDLLLRKEAHGYSSSLATVKKRSDYINWDDYFFAVAELSAKRSKDPHNAKGACIVDTSNRVVGIGYNGFPRGCSDDCLPWTKHDENVLRTKAPFVVHANVNAILNKCSADVVGARLYCQSFPCSDCAKVIIQSGISRVVYGQMPDSSSPSMRASRIMLTMARVEMQQYTPVRSEITLNFLATLEHAVNCTKLDARMQNPTPADETERERFRDLMLKEASYDSLTEPNRKRPDVISWDDYFMAMAFLTAQRSKDPNTQVGACIVDANKRIVGLGYNGFPAGCSDDDLPWARSAESNLHTKYLYVCHAEVNAIMNKGSTNVRGTTLYVALFPCNECAKMIVQSGISEVVYMNDQYHDTDPCRASRILFQMAGVKLRKHVPVLASLRVGLKDKLITK